MNELMNELMNGLMNEWMNEWMNQSMDRSFKQNYWLVLLRICEVITKKIDVPLTDCEET